jgi:peptide-methionine (S)-S-oxide reductase
MITNKDTSLHFGLVFILAGLLGLVPNPLVALNGVAEAQSTSALITSTLRVSTPAEAEVGRSHESREVATFAGGCFWCMQPPFDEIDGVVATTPGYTGGHQKDPTYEQVSAGVTGHAEAVQVLYDPEKVSYARLLEVFWHNIDPTVKDRQFCDVGSQYRTAIFYHNEEQKRLAEESKAALERSKPFNGPIVTMTVPASAFYEAETYHHDYYKKNPLRYKFYRSTCGRDQRLKELWRSER